MNMSLKSLSKRSLLVVLASLLVGSGLTAAVFAAIPNNATGVISACRSNFNGSLRAIDAQSGATCNGLESALSWGSDNGQSALLALKGVSSPQGDVSVVVDESVTRNIVADKKIDPNPENGGRVVFCLKVKFTPAFHQLFQQSKTFEANNGTSSSVETLRLRNLVDQGEVDYINENCGSNYQGMVEGNEGGSFRYTTFYLAN